jgi:hypothetical protein
MSKEGFALSHFVVVQNRYLLGANVKPNANLDIGNSLLEIGHLKKRPATQPLR